MLTNKHLFAQRIITPDERRIYQMHMCGLCHALGNDYGFISRVITNHEMVLLNMLITSQCEQETQLEQRCPLNPFIKVGINRDVASKFAAATAIELARTGAQDGISDTKGYDLRAHFLKAILDTPHQTSIKTLRELQFDASAFTELCLTQEKAELNQSADPALPTAKMTAALFGMTSELANKPANKDILSRIGANYGVYIYLKDALDDYLKDMHRIEYNPLRAYSEETHNKLVLSRKGLEWFLNRLEQVLSDISNDIQGVLFCRNGELIRKLLCEPISQTIAAIGKELTENDEFAFEKLGFADGLKAAAFLLPVPVVLQNPQLVQSCDVLNNSQVNNFILAEDQNIFQSILGVIVCCVLCSCLSKGTGALRGERTGSGIRVREENFCDCCGDMTGCG